MANRRAPDSKGHQRFMCTMGTKQWLYCECVSEGFMRGSLFVINYSLISGYPSRMHSSTAWSIYSPLCNRHEMVDIVKHTSKRITTRAAFEFTFSHSECKSHKRHFKRIANTIYINFWRKWHYKIAFP